jgi:hypothetical protein
MEGTGRSLSQYKRTEEAGVARIGLSYQRREVANAVCERSEPTPFENPARRWQLRARGLI